jgi:hypothetical protein
MLSILPQQHQWTYLIAGNHHEMWGQEFLTVTSCRSTTSSSC